MLPPTISFRPDLPGSTLWANLLHARTPRDGHEQSGGVSELLRIDVVAIVYSHRRHPRCAET